MDITTVAAQWPAHWDGEESEDVDELRVPLGDWTDPTRSIVDGPGAEGHIVRSID